MVPSQESLFIQVNFLDLELGREKDHQRNVVTLSLAKAYLKSNVIT